MRKAKVKNISKSNFLLVLDSTAKGRSFDLKPGDTVALDEDEVVFLSTECQGAFNKGYLEFVEVDKELGEYVEVPQTENKLSQEDIDKMLGLSQAKIKTELAKITASHVLGDIRARAVEENKSNKIIELIDKRIEEVADSLVL